MEISRDDKGSGALRMKTASIADKHKTLSRRDFLKLPLKDRRRILEEQSAKIRKHYDKDQSWRSICG